ncbi:MAG: hypothetical protein R8F63_11810 [Acidimicrobiales bacterium]|nr:hypothetical protein [Acidimicrobiales bacterium]
MAFRNRRKDRNDADPEDSSPAVDDEAVEELTDDADGEWLAYELHEWAAESRSMLAQLLLADGVTHSWQGTTLLAHESVEKEVDALLEEVEQAEARELDPDEPQVAFEMEGWGGELQALLAERLGAVGVPHEFDADGDLVCHEADEEQVELVIEELLARAADEGLEELDGLEANDLLSALFGAADRLRRDVHDSKGVLGVLEHGRRLAGTATPFGFSATNWTSLRDGAGELCDLLEDEDATDADVTDLAVRLRDTLQRII